MSEAATIKAEPRETIGHANRKLHAQGQIPAVLYGAGHKSTPIAVDRHDFQLYMTHHGAAGVLKLEVEGEGKPINALIKEVQHNPVKGTITHIDFLAVRMNVAIHAVAPLNFVNDPVGVREGGVLTIALHEVNIEALPADLPESIDLDVETLEVGHTMTIADITPPSGVTLLDDPETVVCSVTAPTVAVEAEVVEGEAAEEEAQPEVIGEKAEGAEEE